MLKITINSFSYKKGLPIDKSGNGGGFVFDCRCLPNPYKFEEFKYFSGEDKQIDEFFSRRNVIEVFLTSILNITSIAIDKYIDRDFKHLSISFGCTGGQHRSVYLAKLTAEYLKSKYPAEIELNHLEKNNWILKPIAE